MGWGLYPRGLRLFGSPPHPVPSGRGVTGRGAGVRTTSRAGTSPRTTRRSRTGRPRSTGTRRSRSRYRATHGVPRPIRGSTLVACTDRPSTEEVGVDTDPEPPHRPSGPVPWPSGGVCFLRRGSVLVTPRTVGTHPGRVWLLSRDNSREGKRSGLPIQSHNLDARTPTCASLT